MKLSFENQLSFPTILFDTLFGLVLYFSFDSFSAIADPYHLILYIFTLVIVVHWWLIFKSEADMYGTEVTNSVTHLLFGILFLILLEYLVLSSQAFDYVNSIKFLAAIVGVDTVWTALWRFAGAWRTKDKEKIYLMEHELDENLFIDAVLFVSLVVIWALAPALSVFSFLALYVASYLIYIIETFRRNLIDIDFF